jgi:hypothetical protein
MPLIVWILAVLVTAGAALVQGTVGIGFAMISVPILALLDPSLSPAPQLLIALPITISMAAKERHAIDLSGVGWILGGRIPGAILGVALLGIATEAVLDVFIAIIVLGAVLIIGTGFRVRRNTATKLLAGISSGTTGVVSSIGGPPVALVYTRDEVETIRSTLAVVFTFGILTSAFFRWISGNMTLNDVRVALVLIPAAMGGLWIATRVRNKVPRHAVRVSILFISAGAAMALFVRAIL